MYPSRFRYEAPRSLDEAIALLHDGGGEAKVLAGGQSLVPLLKLRFAAPELLVDINNMPGLDYHRVDADGTHPDRRAVPARRPRALRRSCRRSSRRWPRPRRWSPTRSCATAARWSARSATPTRRATGPRSSPRSAATSSRRGRTARRTIPVARLRHRPVPERARLRRDRGRGRDPARPRARPAGGYLKLERRVGDFATAGVAVALELSGGVGHPGRDRADRRRRLDHQRHRRRAGAGRAAARPPTRIGRAADLAAQAAQPRTDHRGSAEYKRHIVRHVRRCGS